MSAGYGEIEFAGPYSILKLTECRITVKQNEHASAVFHASAKMGVTLSKVEQAAEEKRITVLKKDGLRKEKLFTGIVQRVRIAADGMFYEVTLEAVSLSINLDLDKKNRSFQDAALTYRRLAEQVAGERAHAVCGSVCRKALGGPLIQYGETDWEFLKRAASRLGVTVFPDIETDMPVLYFGADQKPLDAVFSEVDYESGISENFYLMGGTEKGLERSDYLYFDVVSESDYPVGAKVCFQGYALAICEKRAVLEKGTLLFYYRLGRAGLFRTVQSCNEKLSGMSLLGKVIATERETLKVHLDIDKSQDVKTAFSFEWTPVSGNMMYCMPQVGTTAALYFSDRDENSAKVINCIGTGACAELGNPENKVFTTEHGKKMELNSDAFCFSGDKQKILLDDAEGICFASEKPVTLVAAGDISFEAPTISGSCPKEMNLIQTGAPVSAESLNSPRAGISSAGNQQYYGERTILAAHGEREAYEPFDDAPEEGEFDWAGLIKNVVLGAAVAVAAAAAVAAIAVTAGAAAPFMAIFLAGAIGGCASVACLAYSDYKSGNVSDPGRYLIKGISGAVSGAVAVIAGPTASATKYGRLVYAMKAGGASAIGSLVGNGIEQMAELFVYGDEMSFREFVISGGVGLVGGGIGGAVSYGFIRSTSELANKLSNGSIGQVTRWLRHGAGVRPKNYARFVQDAINATRYLPRNKIAISTVEEAYKWVLKDPIPVIAATKQYAPIVIRCAVRETSYGSLFSLMTTIFSGADKQEEEKSQQLVKEYLEQYGY